MLRNSFYCESEKKKDWPTPRNQSFVCVLKGGKSTRISQNNSSNPIMAKIALQMQCFVI